MLRRVEKEHVARKLQPVAMRQHSMFHANNSLLTCVAAAMNAGLILQNSHKILLPTDAAGRETIEGHGFSVRALQRIWKHLRASVQCSIMQASICSNKAS